MKRQNITADNNSEFQLLLACIQDDNNPEQNHKIGSLCRKDIDWSELIQKALAHGVIPFVYHRLCAACPDSVPESVLTKIRNHYQVNARHSFLLARELIKILDLFKDGGIKAIPFKGPSLAETVYGDLALRQSSDLDIMVLKKDVPAAINILTSHRYYPDMKHQLDWEAHFVRSDGSCVVDLHWGVSAFNIETCKDASFKIDLAHLWKESVPTRFLGTLVNQFSPEDLLMIRCQDAVKEFWKDGWPQLKWILDISRIIDFYPQMDWEYLFSNARKLGNLRLLYFCLSLSWQLIGISIPSRLLNIIQKDKQAQSLTREVIDKLFIKANVENKFLNPKWGFITRGLFCISLKERICDKVPYFNKILRAYIKRIHRVVKLREIKELLL